MHDANWDRVITRVNQLSPAWLTAVLTRRGALSHGEVAAFETDTGRGNWSQSVTVRLRYTSGSRGEQPRRLFLKMVNTDLDDEFFGRSEVDYYVRDYLSLRHKPLLRCYHARYSESLRRYHLLLQDVSATHVPAGDKPPTLAYGLALAEALGILHAHWWGAERLAEAGAPMHTAAHIQRFVEIAQPGGERIITHFANELEPHWPAAIRNLLAYHPQAMIARTTDASGFTLIHGDVGPGNVLVPRKGTQPLYIIDRQPFNWSLTTWLGVYDLAYAIVLDWEVQQRRRCETPILRRYHEVLQQNGVRGYSWEQLWDDYRLSAAMGVYIAIEYCRGGINRKWQAYWLPMLQRSLTACDDLHCEELWN